MLRCSFENFHNDLAAQDTADHHHDSQRPSSLEASPSAPAQNQLENLASSDMPVTRVPDHVSEVNMLHMELFYHFLSNTGKTLLPGELAEIYCHSAVSCAITHSFLMYTTLAVSAFHLSILRPSQQVYYRGLATSYQTKALTKVSAVLDYVNADNCLAVLLFSHQIGIHSFIDIFAHASPESSFGSFSERLVHSIGLMRGIYAVIHPWWNTLLSTQIGRILVDSHLTHLSKPGDETTKLRELIDAAELTEDNRNTYRQSIASLQYQFDELHHISDDHLATPSTVFAWLMRASSEFLRFLDERRPESLLILAYYSVVLHHRRRSWVIGHAGRYLLLSITKQLGRWWEPCLEWPTREILEK